MKKSMTAVLAAGILGGISLQAQAQQTAFYTGPYGPDGTWNLYEVVVTAATWTNASVAAASRQATATGVAGVAGDTSTGHLVQIGSADENTFVATIATVTPFSGNGNIWLGLTDRTAEQARNRTGWSWEGTGTTLQPGEFSAWAPGEPNDAGGNEDAGEMRTDGLWNDNVINASGTTRRYVIEWEINAEGPIEGAQQMPVVYTAPTGPGGTWNLYRVVMVPESWVNAHNKATNATAGALGLVGTADEPASSLRGHIATVGSQAENALLYRLLAYGGFNGVGAWLGGTDDPAYGGTEAGTNQVTGWVWAGTGEPFTYENFQKRPALNAYQPDNTGGTENFIEMLATGFWNDAVGNSAGDPVGGGGVLRRYVVEWDTASPTPVEGAAQLGPILTGTRTLANPESTTSWAVKDIRGATIGNLYTAIGVANTMPAGTSATETTMPVLNIGDVNPVPTATAGRSTTGLFWPDAPYPGDVANTDDNNIVWVAKSQIELTGPGPYTINVHSDDGFILRVTGATFSEANGLGFVDPGDPSAIFVPYGTGDANTRGIFTVPAAGVYDVEYVGFEGTGGSMVEVSWAEGEGRWDADLAWHLLGGEPTGGTPILPEFGILKAPAPSMGGWGYSYVTGTTTPTNLIDAVSRIQTGTRVEGEVPVINWFDPQNPTAVGFRGIIANDIPWPGNTSADDNNYTIAARTTIFIENPGLYTVGIHADDTAALRIEGARWHGRLSGFSQGHIDTFDRSTIHWPVGSADSNIRAVVEFPDAGEYDLEFVYFEGTGGSSAEVYMAPGVVLTDLDSTEWKLIGNTDALAPVVPEELLNAPVADSGAWGIHVASGLGGTQLTDLSAAIAALGNAAATHSYGFSPVINHVDLNNPGTAGLFANDRVLPGNTAADDNDFAVHARTILDIRVSGHYTFGVRSSDGFALRIKGATWVNRVGAGGYDPKDPSTLLVTGPGISTGPSEVAVRAATYLAAGPHEVDFITFDRDRDFNAEIYATPGNVAGLAEYLQVGAAAAGTAAPNAAQPYRLVGYRSAGPLAVLGVDNAGWSVIQTAPTTATAAPAGWPGTSLTAFDTYLDTQPTTTATRDFVNFNDPGFGGPGSILNDAPFPRNTSTGAGANQEDNFYATRFLANLVVPVTGTYAIGWQGDDGGYLEFLNPPGGVATPTFDRITGNALNSGTIQNSSQGTPRARIGVAAGGGNTRTVGEVFLPAGTYPIRGLWFEGSGSSYFEIFGAPKGGEGQVYNLLTRNGSSSTVTDVNGLQLVTPPLVLRNAMKETEDETTFFSFDVTVVPGGTYDIEKSSDLVNWSVASSIGFSLDTTSYHYSEILDDEQRAVFYRLRRR